MDAGTDAGVTVITGSQYVPSPTRPTGANPLSSAWAFFEWQAGMMVPSGETLQGHDVCWTTGTFSSVDDCPNTVPLNGIGDDQLYRVLTSLTPGATYRWKVRARYMSGKVSEYSAEQTFTVSTSLKLRLPFEGNAMDASGAGHDGVVQNGAGFGAGFVGQAVQLNGTNQLVTVASDPVFNFGTGDFTLSAFVNLNATGGYQVIIGKRATGNGYELYRELAGTLAFYGATCGAVIQTTPLPTGGWHHVVARRRAGVVTLTLDMAPAGTATCADGFTNTGELAVGCNSPSIGCMDAASGAIDEPQVSVGEALSDEAVNQIGCGGHALHGTSPLPAPCTP